MKGVRTGANIAPFLLLAVFTSRLTPAAVFRCAPHLFLSHVHCGAARATVVHLMGQEVLVHLNDGI